MEKDRSIWKINKRKLIALLAGMWIGLSGMAQISHGGEPLPLSLLRNDQANLYVTMPAFDLDEQLRMDSLNLIGNDGAYPFAYKFMADYTPENSGERFTLADGTRVWRLGIHSPGARSINLLFSEYELPEGAQLFLYNEDQTEILGAFNHLNNSELNILPVAPIRGDRLIIEYQEPANAPFHARLKIGEINHGYRVLKGVEPQETNDDIATIPALTCYDSSNAELRRWGHSSVLMIVDGVYMCSGVLVNNTGNDGKPYVLTASHCLNNKFTIANPDYAAIAGSIVFFFNYDSPLCDPPLRGTEEMSMSSSYYRAVNELGDLALLELTEMPPVYYQPYLAGWQADGPGTAPYICLQHPNGADTRLSLSEYELEAKTFSIPEMPFYKEGHWMVPEWTIGHTASGASGSPLFDQDGSVVGILSGGNSTNKAPYRDYFYRLDVAWDSHSSASRQLAYWLDPSGNDIRKCEGLDPYEASPCERLSNVERSGLKEFVTHSTFQGNASEPLFGNNSSGTTTYAEEYTCEGRHLLYGVYIVTPSAGDRYRYLDVDILVYNGENGPDHLLHTEHFQPAYANKSALGDSITETSKSLNRAQESFIRFEQPVEVEGDFYVGYRINDAPEETYFRAYNLPPGATSHNSTWILVDGSWVEATNYSPARFRTALYIDPVIRYEPLSVDNMPIEPTKSPIVIHAYQGLVEVIGAANAPYSLHSINGQIILSGKIGSDRASLNLSSYSSGIYILQVGGKHPIIQKIRL